MRLRRGRGYPTQITVPYVFTVCNPTLQKKFLLLQLKKGGYGREIAMEQGGRLLK